MTDEEITFSYKATTDLMHKLYATIKNNSVVSPKTIQEGAGVILPIMEEYLDKKLNRPHFYLSERKLQLLFFQIASLARHHAQHSEFIFQMIEELKKEKETEALEKE